MNEAYAEYQFSNQIFISKSKIMEITGRVVSDAKVVTLKDDRKVVNFTVAVNDYFKTSKNEEGTQIASFYNCAYWISPKVAERIVKGGVVEVSGRIYSTAYLDQDGKPKSSLHCHVNNIKVHVGGKKGNQKQEDQPSIKDDLPF